MFLIWHSQIIHKVYWLFVKMFYFYILNVKHKSKVLGYIKLTGPNLAKICLTYDALKINYESWYEIFRIRKMVTQSNHNLRHNPDNYLAQGVGTHYLLTIFGDSSVLIFPTLLAYFKEPIKNRDRVAAFWTKLQSSCSLYYFTLIV